MRNATSRFAHDEVDLAVTSEVEPGRVLEARRLRQRAAILDDLAEALRMRFLPDCVFLPEQRTAPPTHAIELGDEGVVEGDIEVILLLDADLTTEACRLRMRARSLLCARARDDADPVATDAVVPNPAAETVEPWTRTRESGAVLRALHRGR